MKSACFQDRIHLEQGIIKSHRPNSEEGVLLPKNKWNELQMLLKEQTDQVSARKAVKQPRFGNGFSLVKGIIVRAEENGSQHPCIL